MFQIDGDVDTFVFPRTGGKKPIDPSNTIPKELLADQEFILFSPDKEKIVKLPEQDEFTLGRIVEGQVITPDVDLNPYDAFDKGVSRLHATITINRQKNKVYLMDLGSANGSKVNNYKIPANSEVPLNHGDLVTLGKFNLKVILPKEME
jgi:pSer/pThr/pTyr-binding forkhead associated (FHA) protein